ncbi:MAG TPA: hypothetical protein VEJ86_05790 [Candidatus Binataceae bacterium]|nr:hypothetical protein [Candidatus Binataceae bacterium]
MARYCGWLRTKNAYFRSDSGERMFNPESTTACYSCLKTQRPVGPDGAPADAESCSEERGCFEEER